MLTGNTYVNSENILLSSTHFMIVQSTRLTGSDSVVDVIIALLLKLSLNLHCGLTYYLALCHLTPESEMVKCNPKFFKV